MIDCCMKLNGKGDNAMGNIIFRIIVSVSIIVLEKILDDKGKM